jgi:hypothetical protein
LKFTITKLLKPDLTGLDKSSLVGRAKELVGKAAAPIVVTVGAGLGVHPSVLHAIAARAVKQPKAPTKAKRNKPVHTTPKHLKAQKPPKDPDANLRAFFAAEKKRKDQGLS